MRCAVDYLQRGALDELRREKSRSCNRHDLVVVAVKNQSGYIELLQIFSLVGLREGFYAVILCLDPRHHALQPKEISQTLRNLCARTVSSVKRGTEILPVLCAITEDRLADLVKHLDRCAGWIGSGFEHQGRHGTDQNCHGYALCAVASDVASDFTSASGMADMDRVLYVELLDQGCEIVGIRIHVVAFPGLAGSPVAAAIVRNAPVTAVG